MKRLPSLAGACLVFSCGGAASDLTPAEAAAERAYSAGRYVEAAERFADAARTSPAARDREEAKYRQAMSLERAGRTEGARAALEELLRTFPHGARAPRALFELALLDVAAGDEERAHQRFETVITTYPDSGPAPSALHRMEDSLGPKGEAALRAYLEALAPRVAGSELAQHVANDHARSREREGDFTGAEAEYLALADRFPYPRGIFWDDALYRSGEIDVKRGAPREAIVAFERLLAAREPSFLQGSYERGRYADAAFRVAELYRDVLHDSVRARREFEQLAAAFPTSRLRDDAMWSAARLAAGSGDSDGACRLLRSLVAEEPESRYVACASSLCPGITLPPRAGPCHEYLTRGTP